jgi:hypothetical protein
MKLGPIEGTKEEITGFFQDNGLNAGDYFQIPEPPIKSVWLVIPAACVVVASGTLTLLESMTAGQQKFTFLVGCFTSVWLATVIQLRFKQVWATGIIVVGCLLLMLVALGVVEPKQILDEVRSFRK